jgi:hypothetical protein
MLKAPPQRFRPRLVTAAPPYKPMVLVSYILDNDISILQTKFSNRERHETRSGGL